MKFTIYGDLPAPWEDFLTNDPLVPNVTIVAGQKKEAQRLCNDGWITVDITDPAVTEKRAAEILSSIAKKPATITAMKVSPAV